MTAKDQLLEYYEAQALALIKELELTRQWIYREMALRSDISAETVQLMIDNYIKENGDRD